MDLEEYHKILLSIIELYKEYQHVNLKREFKKLKITKKLYSKIPKRVNFFPSLGIFDFYIELASNVTPIINIQPDKPTKGNYMVYNFSYNKLVYVDYFENGTLRTGGRNYVDGNTIISRIQGFSFGIDIQKREEHVQIIIDGTPLFSSYF